MKKIIAASLLSMLVTQNTKAQNWLTTGNAVSGTDFIGTTNNLPLLFKVNNSAAGRIENLGGFAGLFGNTALGYETLIE